MTFGILVLLSLLILSLIILQWFLRRTKRKNTVGIFHLYCASGGGGERVLWHIVKVLLNQYPKYSIYIFTHKEQKDSMQILLQAKNQFKIDLISDRNALERLEFIPIGLAPLVEAKKYPFLTLFLQNLMSVIVAIQAAYYLTPEIYMETIGFTHTLPVFKFLGCKVITYVHYPTISNDMIKNVHTSSHASFNNREIFVRSPILRHLKLVYYRLLAYSYGFAGRRADLVLVNSTWTQNHIESLWQRKVRILYPPCVVNNFEFNYDEKYKGKHNEGLKIVSVAQFRPEKNHETQIEAFDIFLNKSNCPAELTLYGGCRDQDDQKRVDYLIDLIHRLDLGSRVRVITNAPFEQLMKGIREADVALHTMENEHFGIVLLEFMAAGLITLAHDSGGPKSDIIVDSCDGLLCKDVDDFADKLLKISKMSYNQRKLISERAVQKAGIFNMQHFEASLISCANKFFID